MRSGELAWRRFWQDGAERQLLAAAAGEIKGLIQSKRANFGTTQN